MNGSIRETVATTQVIKLTWSYSDEPRIDRKELAILCERGRLRFEALRNRPPENDNDWWLAWSDDEISFCFLVEMEREAP